MARVIALGFFDGVHLGHGALLSKTAETASALGLTPAVMTFDRSPGKDGLLLSSVADRILLIRTLYGRRRSVPEIHASQYMVRQLGERLAMNTPIQGTAADIIKLAMIRTEEALRKQCPEAELILQIHDELILRVPKAKEEEAKRILRESMENAACLDVKLDVDLNVGQNWYELK